MRSPYLLSINWNELVHTIEYGVTEAGVVMAVQSRTDEQGNIEDACDVPCV